MMEKWTFFILIMFNYYVYVYFVMMANYSDYGNK